MKVVNCDCGWSFRNESEDEVVKAVQDHAKEAHGMDNVTREQALANVKEE